MILVLPYSTTFAYTLGKRTSHDSRRFSSTGSSSSSQQSPPPILSYDNDDDDDDDNKNKKNKDYNNNNNNNNNNIANVGGTVPEVLIEYYTDTDATNTNNIASSNHHWKPKRIKKSEGGPFFWTDALGHNESKNILQWNQHFYKGKTKDAAATLQHPSTTTTATATATTIDNCFSILSWNILSQRLYDVNIVQKVARNLPVHKFSWEERVRWILETLTDINPDIICLQEVQYEQYYNDLLPYLQSIGYDGVIQGDKENVVKEIKRRKGKGSRAHYIATFWKKEKFQPYMIPTSKKKKKKKNDITTMDGIPFHMARGRTLTSVLETKTGANDNKSVLAVLNCHLEGHPQQYSARIRQLQHGLEDLIRRVPGDSNDNNNKNNQITYNGLCVCGDFNCELQSSVCSKYIKLGRVGKKGGLGGVHGTSALVIPPKLLECEEVSEVLSPILEWGQIIPDTQLDTIEPHPFRHNTMTSAYPIELGKKDPTTHFTFCANPYRPVAGLDQLWYTSYSLTRIGLYKCIRSPIQRTNILNSGLPIPHYPSDHLPIGAIFQWNTYDDDDDNDIHSNHNRVHGDNNNNNNNNVVKLIVIDDKDQSKQLHNIKPKSPIMAYAELDMLLVSCPYDTEEQRKEVEDIVETVIENLPQDTKKEKPTNEQIQQLVKLKERKKILLMNASETVRPTLQRILKLKKEVDNY